MPAQILIWLIIVFTSIADSIALPAAGMSVNWETRWPLIVIASALVIVSVICLWLRQPQASRAVSAFAQFIAMAIAFSIFSYALMATSPYPMADPLFMRADAAIGFDWLSWFSWVESHTKVSLILHYAYNSVIAQFVVVFIVLSYTDAARVDELLVANMVSLYITFMIMFFLPGVGALSAHHAGIESWREEILALRAHSLLVIENAYGIITFPSFHTVEGVLLIYISRHHKLLLYPMIMINVIMIASALSEGAHYLVDIISGLAVAFASIAITQSLLDWWTGRYVTRFFVKAPVRPG
jgi:membrane-associated phospholipid phosphatase